jgi:hypothetical protein
VSEQLVSSLTAQQCLSNALGPATHLHSADWRYTFAVNPDGASVFFDLEANATLWGFGKAGAAGTSKLCMLPSGTLSLTGERVGRNRGQGYTARAAGAAMELQGSCRGAAPGWGSCSERRC